MSGNSSDFMNYTELEFCLGDLRRSRMAASLPFYARLRWRALSSTSKAALGGTLACVLLIHWELGRYVRTFRRLGAKGKPWSLLIASQLVCDNVTGQLGLSFLVEHLWLRLAFSNAAVASPAFRWLAILHHTAVALGIWATQILALAGLRDRLTAIRHPMAHRIADHRRRALRTNLVAYGLPLLTLAALITVFEPPWQSVDWEACLRARPGLWRLHCASPASRQLFWWSDSLADHRSLDATGHTVFALFTLLSLGTDLGPVWALSLRLVWEFRAYQRGRAGAGREGGAEAASRRHEDTVTVAILAEAAQLIAVALVQALSTAHSVAVGPSALSAVVPGIVMIAQFYVGSYRILPITSKTFQDELRSDPWTYGRCGMRRRWRWAYQAFNDAFCALVVTLFVLIALSL